MIEQNGIIRLEKKSLFGLYNLENKLMVLNNSTFFMVKTSDTMHFKQTDNSLCSHH